MKSIFSFLAFLFLLNNTLQAQLWEATSGPGGSLLKLIVHPDNANIIYGVSTARCFLKSTDCGDKWTIITDGLTLSSSNNPRFEDLAIDKAYPDILYISISQPEKDGKSFLYRSTNGGLNWTAIKEGIVHKVCADKGKVFALSDSVLFYSSDEGNTWEICNDSLAQDWFYGILLDKEGNLWILRHLDLIKSSDYGRNFETFTFPNSVCMKALDISEVNEKKIVSVSVSFKGMNRRDSVFISKNEGKTWINCTNSLNVRGLSTISEIKLSKHNPDMYYIGTPRGFFRTTNSGSNWEEYNEGLVLPHAIFSVDGVSNDYKPAIYCLALSDVNPDLIVASTLNDGVFRSYDNGENWQMLSVPPYSVNSFAVSSEGEIYSCCDAGIFSFESNLWKPTTMLSGQTYSPINPVAVSPFNNRIILCGNETNFGNSFLYKSNDKGLSWSVKFSSHGDSYFTRILFDPIDSLVVYAAHMDGLIISRDQGDSWSNIKLSSGSVLEDIQVNPVDTKAIYLLWRNGKIDRSTDGGLSWSEIKSMNDSLHTCLKLDPQNPDVLYLGSFSLSKSMDAGNTWSKKSFNRKITDIAIDSETDELFIATYNEGIWRSSDGGNTFNKMPPLPIERINSLAIYKKGEEKLLLAGTTGAGVFIYKISTSSVDKDNVSYVGQFQMYQNYPNPFNPSTTIRYALPKQSFVEVKIYNIMGNEVRSFTMNSQQAGYHDLQWDGKNMNNEQASSGTYIYRLKAVSYEDGKVFDKSAKMMLVK